MFKINRKKNGTRVVTMNLYCCLSEIRSKYVDNTLPRNNSTGSLRSIAKTTRAEKRMARTAELKRKRKAALRAIGRFDTVLWSGTLLCISCWLPFKKFTSKKHDPQERFSSIKLSAHKVFGHLQSYVTPYHPPVNPSACWVLSTHVVFPCYRPDGQNGEMWERPVPLAWGSPLLPSRTPSPPGSSAYMLSIE